MFLLQTNNSFKCCILCYGWTLYVQDICIYLRDTPDGQTGGSVSRSGGRALMSVSYFINMSIRKSIYRSINRLQIINYPTNTNRHSIHDHHLTNKEKNPCANSYFDQFRLLRSKFMRLFASSEQAAYLAPSISVDTLFPSTNRWLSPPMSALHSGHFPL